MMSVSHSLLSGLSVAALCVAGSAMAAEDEAPDLAFLEYLGMWEESDEEWLLIDDAVAAEDESRNDPAPDGEASTEKEDDA